MDGPNPLALLFLRCPNRIIPSASRCSLFAAKLSVKNVSTHFKDHQKTKTTCVFDHTCRLYWKLSTRINLSSCAPKRGATRLSVITSGVYIFGFCSFDWGEHVANNMLCSRLPGLSQGGNCTAPTWWLCGGQKHAWNEEMERSHRSECRWLVQDQRGHPMAFELHTHSAVAFKTICSQKIEGLWRVSALMKSTTLVRVVVRALWDAI